MKQYRNRNKERLKEYINDRRKNNINTKIVHLLSSRIRHGIKDNVKSAHTKELIGCSIEELKDHLQKTAIQNGYFDFNINDYVGKEYHIDHIIPCDAFYLECSYHQRLCFHWSNLQILKANINLIKKNKWSIDN